MQTIIWKDLQYLKKNAGGSRVVVNVDDKNGTVKVVGLPVKLVIAGKTYTSKVGADKKALFGSVQEIGVAEITCADSTQNFYNAGTLQIVYYGAYEVTIENANPYENWLLAAGYTINNYPEIADVLADAEALDKLFNIHNSVDEFIKWYNSDNAMLTQFLENENAMKAIGDNDYAADNLMAIPEVCEALLASEYWEYILNAKVPTMTSDTSPEGKAFASSGYSSDFSAYKAFDGDETTAWGASSTTFPQHLGYLFTNPTCVNKIYLLPTLAGEDDIRVKTFKIQASNDGSSWVDLTDEMTYQSGTYFYTFDNDNYYLYYRVLFISSDSGITVYISELQFYGRQLNALVPTMTSNTTPSGECYSNATYSGFEPFRAFDGDSTTAWEGRTDEKCWYRFTNPVVLKKAYVYSLDSYQSGLTGCGVTQFKLLASNDGTEWTTFGTYDITSGGEKYININDNTPYLYVAIETISGGIPGTCGHMVGTLQFYGPSYEERYTVVSGQFDYVAWLETAGLSGYADLDAVLADEKAVRTLMTKTASVDYMVEGLAGAPEVASKILNDVYVAKWVNYREYAYASLSGVAELKAIMDASGKYGTYISVEKDAGCRALVPTMTSDTCAVGEVITNGVYDTRFAGYYAFNGLGSDNGSWTSPNTVPSYIGYKFTQPTCVKRIYVNPGSVQSGTLQVSNDGSTWADLKDISYDRGVEVEEEIDNDNYYMYYRLNFTNVTADSNGRYLSCVYELQFYGYQLIPMVPTLTSNNGSDGGVASASSYYSYSGVNSYPYMAFDNNTTTGWSGAEAGGGWIQYKFNNPTCVSSAYFIALYSDSLRVKDYVIQASNNGTTWDDLYTGSVVANGTSNVPVLVSFDNTICYEYYRLNITSVYGGGAAVNELQFYGVEKWQPKGLVPVMTSNTAPYGEVSSSGYFNSSGNIFYPYYAFESDVVRGWIGTNNSTTAYIQYKFTTPTMVDSFKMQVMTNRNFTFTLQGSNDGTTYTNLTTDTNEIPYSDTDDVFHIKVMNNGSYYLYYKLNCVSSTGHEPGFGSLQFYGRQLEALVPPMTSNTAPVGEASASSSYSDTAPYKAFLNASSGLWYESTSNTTTGSYVQYKLEKPTNIKRIVCTFGSAHASSHTTKAKAQYSTDGSTWMDVENSETQYTGVGCGGNMSVDCDLESVVAVRITNTYKSDSILCAVQNAQLYGTPDYDSRTYIYDHGVELVEVTAEVAGGAIASKELDYLYLYKSGNNAVHAHFKSEVLDLSKYNTLRINADLKMSTSLTYNIRYFDTSVYSTSNSQLTYLSVMSGDALLDITNVNQDGYISVEVQTGNVSESYMMEGSISEWWLE